MFECALTWQNPVTVNFTHVSSCSYSMLAFAAFERNTNICGILTLDSFSCLLNMYSACNVPCSHHTISLYQCSGTVTLVPLCCILQVTMQTECSTVQSIERTSVY